MLFTRRNKEIDGLIAEVERRNELRTAIWRFMALVVFAVSILFEPDIVSQKTHMHLLLVYGGVSLFAVLLAALNRFRPWLNWAYVAVDASLVVHLAAEHVLAPNTSAAEALATPSLAVAFVLLSHASMRLRPGAVAAYAFIVIAGSTVVVTRAWFGRMPVEEDPTALSALAAETLWLLSFAAAAAIQVVLVIDMRRLLTSAIAVTRERANLARFFAPEVAEHLAHQSGNAGLTRREAAVLFVDIRGFTGLSERLEPEAIASLLAEYRQRVTEAIFQWEGTVDKFVGDGVMAVFGFPFSSPNDGERAFHCAVEISHRLSVWSERRARDGMEPLEFGIGVHVGNVIGGVLSSGRHSEYTVVGDAVNVADRLQGLSKAHDARIVASGTLIDRLPVRELASGWQRRHEVVIDGRSEVIGIYVLPYSESWRDEIRKLTGSEPRSGVTIR